MNKLKRLMAITLSKGNNKLYIGDTFTYQEWIKWLRYKPKFILDRIDYLKKKDNITSIEIKELSLYKEQEEMAILLNKYINKDVNEKEYMVV